MSTLVIYERVELETGHHYTTFGRAYLDSAGVKALAGDGVIAGQLVIQPALVSTYTPIFLSFINARKSYHSCASLYNKYIYRNTVAMMFTDE